MQIIALRDSHSAKAFLPRGRLSHPWIYTVSRLWQPLKAASPTLVTPAGIEKDLNAQQFLNARLPIYLRLGKDKDGNL